MGDAKLLITGAECQGRKFLLLWSGCLYPEKYIRVAIIVFYAQKHSIDVS